MKKLLSLLLVLCVALGALPALAQEAAPATLEDVLSRLDVAYAHRVTKAISELGDNPDVGNRSSGSAAERQAAELIASELKDMGFDTVNTESFTADTWSFNKGRVYYNDESGAEQFIALGGFATNLTFEGDVQIVYAGRGTDADYEGLDVTDKVVLVDINQAEDWWAEIPAYEAYIHGAKCVILCNVEGYATWDEDTVGSQDICGPAYAPAFAISQNGAKTLRALIDAGDGEATVRLDVDSVVTENGTSQNVWAEIPGKTDEVIYFFAHYDGYYHSFFDDAEGVGSVLAIARAFKESGYTPDKTLRFVLHGAEEWGRTDTEYDWSAGAYHMIYDLHPEWAENAFVILNIDGMYPVKGHTLFSLASVDELNGFVAPIAQSVFEGSGYEVEPKAYTSCWTEDFSYVRKGVPSVVASHAEPEEIYHGTAYHSSMDSDKLGVDEDAWAVVLKLFATLAVEFDDLAARPMAFTAHFKAMEAAYAGEAAQDFDSVYAAAEAVDARVAQLNADYAAALESGDADKAAQLRAEGIALDKKLHEIYAELTDRFFAFDYEDNLIFTFEMNEWNIDALETAIAALETGDGETAYNDCFSGVDYNWYAYSFSAETYAYMLAKMNNNTAGTWGEGMIRYPGENLWTVIRTVAEKMDAESADYSAEIAVLHEALERQKGYRAEIEADFAESLSAMTELFNSVAE